MPTNPLRLLAVLTFLLPLGLVPASAQQGNMPATRPPQLKLTTPAYSDGGEIPVKYTCAAKPSAVSPLLEWTDVPKDTATFALIFHDMDAQPNKGVTDVTHWMVWNIPADAHQLPEGVPATPQSADGMIQGKNIRGETGYRGPCAPPGKPHHYTFELYALDQKLDLGPDATRADLLKAMDGHIIGKSAYVGMFHQ
jgi:Raf kinase inhibitor-like YbhB/YbcL family protein